MKYTRNVERSINKMDISNKMDIHLVLSFKGLRNGVLFVLAWVTWMACLRIWRASVGGMLAWVAC